MTGARPRSARVEVLADGEALAERAAAEVLRILGAAVKRRNRASWVLSGGATPRRLYELVAQHPEALDWRRVLLFWSDERCVEPTSPASNYRLARDTLLAGLPIAAHGVRRVQGELPASEAARRYALEVATELASGPFDLVLLGLGRDGHTASLFPGALPAGGALAAAVEAPVKPRWRVSLSASSLASCRRLIFLVSGAAKAPAVARALAPAGAARPVSDMVRPAAGRTLWLVDYAAAAELPNGPPAVVR